MSLQNEDTSVTTNELILNTESLLSGLNPAQLQAVKHDPAIPLQILAGPGSGKTKVLTSRIAHLILIHKIAPSSICAVTFTNKAANEMRERLKKLIGKQKTGALQMGTFHSLCARFLRMHSKVVALGENFTICDADESKKLIAALLKPYKDYMIENDIILSEGSAASVISKAKAKGHSAAIVFKEMEEGERSNRRLTKPGDPTPKSDKSIERILAEIYIGYEQVLKDNNALDFDDLLIYGVKLFSTHQESVLWCKHILVDEFQDTNTMQYELMKSIGIRRCVTIVGDPDQSIYGWRSAEVVNLSRMRKDFPRTQQIFLEQNYRSTASILRSCLAIVAEDKKRIPKLLHTSHPLGPTPFVGEFDDDKLEAGFIAFEIKRCVANMGGILKWGDFVVLLRYNALSRNIENAMQMQGIPCRILGGHKFFERMEVKDVLAYLQLVDNPDFNPAFVRAVKAPTRGAGDKSLAEIAAQAEKLKISQLQLVEKIHDNKIPDIKPLIKKKLVSFVKTIRAIRKLDEEKTSPSEMIKKVVEMIGYEDYLKKTQQDWESRWENVQELITFANEVESGTSAQDSAMAENDPNVSAQQSVLRQFLQSSMLSSEGDNQTEEQNREKVTISTCHAAKGLEWPVVIVPSVDRDTFPFYRTEDIDEERRLLYVACTRAQTMLYLLFARERTVGGKKKTKDLSQFVSIVKGKNEGFFSHEVPRFLPTDRAVISRVLDRPIPNEEEVERRLVEIEMSGDRVQPTYQTPRGEMSTTSLTGVKSSIFGAPVDGQANLTALYAAPDALAVISSSFMKDYKKTPFGKNPTKNFNSNSNPFVKHVVVQNTFMPASSGVYSYSIGTGVMSYSSTSNLTTAEVQPAPRAHALSFEQGNMNSLIDQLPVQLHQTSGLNSSRRQHKKPPSTSDSVTPFSLYSAAPSLSSRTQHRLLISKTPPRSSSSSLSSPFYDQNHPPGECSSRPIPSSSSMKTDVAPATFSHTAYNMAPADSSMVYSSPPKASAISNPYSVSNLPTVIDSGPRMQASNPLQTTPPRTAGIKRRLGMGRTTAGYSNKKFKPPT